MIGRELQEPCKYLDGEKALVEGVEMTDLSKEFKKLYSLQDILNDRTMQLTMEIETLTQRRDELAKPYQEEISKTEERIRQEILARGESFECRYGKATFRKAYDRTNWDGKKLAGYAAAHPAIEAFKSITHVDAGVSIKTKLIGGIV